MIFNQETALRWLIHSARHARHEGRSGLGWLQHIDRYSYSLARAYVSDKQIRAIQALVWARNPML